MPVQSGDLADIEPTETEPLILSRQLLEAACLETWPISSRLKLTQHAAMYDPRPVSLETWPISSRLKLKVADSYDGDAPGFRLETWPISSRLKHMSTALCQLDLSCRLETWPISSRLKHALSAASAYQIQAETSGDLADIEPTETEHAMAGDRVMPKVWRPGRYRAD